MTGSGIGCSYMWDLYTSKWSNGSLISLKAERCGILNRGGEGNMSTSLVKGESVRSTRSLTVWEVFLMISPTTFSIWDFMSFSFSKGFGGDFVSLHCLESSYFSFPLGASSLAEGCAFLVCIYWICALRVWTISIKSWTCNSKGFTLDDSAMSWSSLFVLATATSIKMETCRIFHKQCQLMILIFTKWSRQPETWRPCTCKTERQGQALGATAWCRPRTLRCLS